MAAPGRVVEESERRGEVAKALGGDGGGGGVML